MTYGLEVGHDVLHEELRERVEDLEERAAVVGGDVGEGLVGGDLHVGQIHQTLLHERDVLLHVEPVRAHVQHGAEALERGLAQRQARVNDLLEGTVVALRDQLGLDLGLRVERGQHLLLERVHADDLEVGAQHRVERQQGLAAHNEVLVAQQGQESLDLGCRQSNIEGIESEQPMTAE